MSSQTSRKTEEPIPPKPRGRPRSDRARSAILKAARDLLEEGGLGAVTIEAVAARAGVGKPTIYRSWPNRHAVAIAAFLETAIVPSPGKAHASPRAALLRLLKELVRIFATPGGRHITGLLAASIGDTEMSKAFRNYFILANRKEARRILDAAIAAGEMRADIDPEIALDLIFAPVYFRLLAGHAKLDESFAEALLADVFKGLGAKTPNNKKV